MTDVSAGFGDDGNGLPPIPEDPDNDELAARYPVGFTDYPFVELGDIPGVKAPIRLCWIVAWDRDKYADVMLVGHPGAHQVKYGYIYKTPGRCGDVPSYRAHELDELLRDNCEVCKGEKGGALGNENIVDGVVMCDYCQVVEMKRRGVATEYNGVQ